MFKGVTADAFDETIQEWMEVDRPDPLTVQTMLQVMIETGNTRSIDTILDAIEVRIAGGLPPNDQNEPESKRAVREGWWCDCVIEPFENAFKTEPRLRRRIGYLKKRARRQTQKMR
jgi:hypothetical protein